MRLIYYAKSTLLLKNQSAIKKKWVNSKYCRYIIWIVYFKVRNRNSLPVVYVISASTSVSRIFRLSRRILWGLTHRSAEILDQFRVCRLQLLRQRLSTAKSQIVADKIQINQSKTYACISASMLPPDMMLFILQEKIGFSKQINIYPVHLKRTLGSCLGHSWVERPYWWESGYWAAVRTACRRFGTAVQDSAPQSSCSAPPSLVKCAGCSGRSRFQARAPAPCCS